MILDHPARALILSAAISAWALVTTMLQTDPAPWAPFVMTGFSLLTLLYSLAPPSDVPSWYVPIARFKGLITSMTVYMFFGLGSLQLRGALGIEPGTGVSNAHEFPLWFEVLGFGFIIVILPLFFAVTYGRRLLERISSFPSVPEAWDDWALYPALVAWLAGVGFGAHLNVIILIATGWLAIHGVKGLRPRTLRTWAQAYHHRTRRLIPRLKTAPERVPGTLVLLSMPAYWNLAVVDWTSTGQVAHTSLALAAVFFLAYGLLRKANILTISLGTQVFILLSLAVPVVTGDPRSLPFVDLHPETSPGMEIFWMIIIATLYTFCFSALRMDLSERTPEPNGPHVHRALRKIWFLLLLILYAGLYIAAFPRLTAGWMQVIPAVLFAFLIWLPLLIDIEINPTKV